MIQPTESAVATGAPSTAGPLLTGGQPLNTLNSEASLGHAIFEARGYLNRTCNAQGKFTYSRNILSGQSSSEYNIIRHAGTLYSLYLLNQFHPDSESASAVLRGARFMRSAYMTAPLPGVLVVWSAPTGNGGQRVAELGGAGLGLVALYAARDLRSDKVPIKDLQALGRFILFMQRNNGSFYSRYRKNRSSAVREDSRGSLYYPGEAALGLV
jgi:hypothetical protein